MADLGDSNVSELSEHLWHALDESDVVKALDTQRTGISTDEAESRLSAYGPNQLAEEPPTSKLSLVIHQFRSPLIYILLIAALITLLLEEYKDVGVIAAVLILNAIIGFTQERKADTSVRALIRMAAPHARVIRDNREWEIESRELVPGDVVLLESGCQGSR